MRVGAKGVEADGVASLEDQLGVVGKEEIEETLAGSLGIVAPEVLKARSHSCGANGEKHFEVVGRDGLEC